MYSVLPSIEMHAVGDKRCESQAGSVQSCFEVDFSTAANAPLRFERTHPTAAVALSDMQSCQERRSNGLGRHHASRCAHSAILKAFTMSPSHPEDVSTALRVAWWICCSRAGHASQRAACCRFACDRSSHAIETGLASLLDVCYHREDALSRAYSSKTSDGSFLGIRPPSNVTSRLFGPSAALPINRKTSVPRQDFRTSSSCRNRKDVRPCEELAGMARGVHGDLGERRAEGGQCSPISWSPQSLLPFMTEM